MGKDSSRSEIHPHHDCLAAVVGVTDAFKGRVPGEPTSLRLAPYPPSLQHREKRWQDPGTSASGGNE